MNKIYLLLFILLFSSCSKEKKLGIPLATSAPSTDTSDSSTSGTSSSESSSSESSNTSSAIANASSLTVSTKTTSTLTLSWTAASGSISAYLIAYAQGATAPSNCDSATLSSSSTSKQITGLTSGTQYSFLVCAQNSVGLHSTGTSVSGTTSYDPPPNPSSLTGSAASPTSLNISWSSGGGSTSSYTLAYQSGATAPSDCSSGTVVNSSTIGSSTSYTITGLSSSTQYSIRVCANNSNSTPDTSSGSTASATTSAPEAAPNDPTGLSITVNSSTAITASWTSGGGTTSKFALAYKSGGTAPANCTSDSTVAYSTIGSSTSYQITGLTANTQYSVRVCAVNQNSPVDYSTGVTSSATTSNAPAPPDVTGVTATVNSATAITVSWTSGGGSTATYKMSWKSGSTAPTSCSTDTVVTSGTIGASTSHQVTSLTPGTTYSFRVCALNNNSTPDVASGVTVSGTTSSNNAPVAQAASINVTEDVAYNGTLSATDADSHSLTYSIVSNPSKGSVNITNTSTGAFTYTPSSNLNGADSFTFRATDGFAFSNTATITVSIAGVSDSPTVSLSNRLFPINSSNDPLVPETLYTLTATATDPDGDSISSWTCTYTTIGKHTSDPNYIGTARDCSNLVSLDTTSIMDGTTSSTFSNGTLNWRPHKTAIGTYKLTISATDSTAAVGSSDILLTVRPNFSSSLLLAGFDSVFSTGVTGANSVAAGARIDSSGNDDLTTIYALKGSFSGDLSNMNTTAPWAGTGAYNSPYHLSFNGSNDYLDLGTVLSGQTKTTITAWVNPSSVTTDRATIFDNASSTGGIRVIQMDSKLQLYLGPNPSYSTYSSYITGDSPIAYYPFLETSGTSAADFSANTNTATHNSTTINQTGPINKAVLLSGTSSYLSTFDWNISATDNGAVEMWINPSSLAADTRLITAPGGTAGSLRILSNGSVEYYSGGWLQIGPAGSIESGKWQHFLLQFGSNSMTLYVNGVSKGSLGVGSGFNSGTISIGRRYQDFYGTNFQGYIAELAIYNRQLTSGEIAERMLGNHHCTSTNSLTNSAWKFISATFDSSSAKLYIDGLLECTLSLGSSNFASTSNFYVGTDKSLANYWSGKVKNVMVYSDASTDIVNENYSKSINEFRQTHIPTNYMVSGLRFNFDAAYVNGGTTNHSTGCTGSTSAKEFSNGGLTGTLTNFASCGATSGWLGDGQNTNPYRLALDGSNDYVTFGDNIDIVDPDNTNNGRATTFEFWIKLPNTNQACAFFSKKSFTSPWYGYTLGVGSDGQNPFASKQLSFFAASASGWWGINSVDSIADGNWHHIVYVMDGGASSKSMKIYVDGTEKTINTGTDSSTGIPMADTSSDLQIAGEGGTNSVCSMEISVARVYDFAMTSTQVSSNCNADKKRFSGHTCN